MKQLERHIGVLVLLGLGLTLAACAAPKPGAPASTPPIDTIRNIAIDDSEKRTQIVVEGGAPIQYTTYINASPPKFIVDLAGMEPGEFGKTIEVGKGGVSHVLVSPGEGPGKLVRLEVELTEPVEANARAEGNTLIIDVPHPVAAPATAQPAPVAASTPPQSAPVTGAPASAESPSAADRALAAAAALAEEHRSAPATVLSSVKVTKDKDTVRVTITGDGSLQPDVQLVGQDRLVLDFVKTTSLVGKREISVRHKLLKAIRIGQHKDPKKVRIVFDLSNSPIYDVESKGDQVLVVMSKAPEKAVEGQAAVPPSILPDVSASPAAVPPPTPEEKTVSAEIPVEDQGTGKAASAAPTVVPAEAEKTVQTAKASNGRTEMEKTYVGHKKYVGRRISLDFQDADVTNVLRLIADVSGMNVVLSDDVKGRVTLKLVNVPWDQALEIILKMNDLGQVREGNILRISTLSNITRQQDEEAKASETRLKALALDTRVVYVNYAKAKDLADPLKKVLSSRGEMTIDDRTNAIIVKDVDEKIREIQELVQRLDTPTPQVQIEARIVEVNPTFTQSLGIQWGGNYRTVTGSNVVGLQGGNSGGLNSPTPDFAVNLPAAPLFGAFGLTWGQFTNNPFQLDLRLSAGVSTGMTKIISTPKITVLDNQEAKIEQGSTIPYATTSANGGTNTTFIDAKLTLTVTPHVTRDGSVIMKVKATNDEPGEVLDVKSGPTIRRKEATTNVLVKDGETTVIGGIYKTKKATGVTGVPFLRDIPGLGWFFKNTTENDEVSELLIFLTPRIIQ